MTLTVELTTRSATCRRWASHPVFSPMPDAVFELADPTQWEQGVMIGNGPSSGGPLGARGLHQARPQRRLDRRHLRGRHQGQARLGRLPHLGRPGLGLRRLGGRQRRHRLHPGRPLRRATETYPHATEGNWASTTSASTRSRVARRRREPEARQAIAKASTARPSTRPSTTAPGGCRPASAARRPRLRGRTVRRPL